MCRSIGVLAWLLLWPAAAEQLTTNSFVVSFDSSGRASRLAPKDLDFDFTPGDRLAARSGPEFYHLGDATLRIRSAGGTWQACRVTAALTENCPVIIRREWRNDNGLLTLRYRLENRTGTAVEIGAFGVAMVFNNELTTRSLEESHEKCSFADPYIGGDAGYLQVTRLNGKGPALLVLPETGTPFEAYRPIKEDPTKRDVTFEGFYEWMVHSKAYAENEWRNAKPWNTPTSRTLQSGEAANYGFRFVLAPAIGEIERSLEANGRPVAIGIPGYVLPLGETGRLFLKAPSRVTAMTIEPPGAITIVEDPQPTPHGWRSYTLRGAAVRRCRLVISYANGERQFVHYNVILSQADQVRKLADFEARHQWYTDTNDPFGRAFSFMPYDREADRMVLQEKRVYIAGLSDEVGAGPNLAMGMKNLGMPDPDQVSKLDDYADHALWGRLQSKTDYGIRASLFYWDPKAFPGYYTITNGIWDKQRSQTTWRAYNYPHQAAIYWVLYRLSRNYKGLVKYESSDWYLRQAYLTAMAMRTHCGPGAFLHLDQYGLMVGSVFVEILKDLQREGWMREANDLALYMRSRAKIWESLKYPYGSEMPWDSTGQEEVYSWCKYFGIQDRADVTLNAILAYAPTVPNWAYNGSSRRYFDTFVYGKRPEITRELDQYGASLNAIPLLDEFRDRPGDLRLLRAGYAGATGPLANIDARGIGSQCFLADPAVMDYEPYTGDFGQAFYGYAYSAGAYVVKDPEFGWLCFGCDVEATAERVRITPRDAFRTRVFLAPVGVWLTLDVGSVEKVELGLKDGMVTVELSPATAHSSAALLRINSKAGYHPRTAGAVVRDAYEVPLGSRSTRIELVGFQR